jgi:cystathionine beta-lyase/cystathionine gamma-synthase
MLLGQGDHVVAGTDIYGGTYRLLHKIVDRAGIDVSLISTTDPAAVERALTDRTKLLWLETPGNPLLSITDIAACAQLARRRGVLVGVDNTFASPVLTRPLELGADIVMHSATKYLGGHSDVLGGALVVGSRELYDRLYFVQNATGAVLGPLESFLCSRGLKTLELRVREQSRTAQALAEFLQADPRVKHVYYPGLAEHPGHALAARQMGGQFGAMLSFELAGDYAAAKKLVEATRLFQLAVSLGAVESLIEQPASMSHASYAREARLAHGITDSLIRASVGLEGFEDLRDDLDRALAVAAK